MEQEHDLPIEIVTWCRQKAAAFSPRRGGSKTQGTYFAGLLNTCAQRLDEVKTQCKGLSLADAHDLVRRHAGRPYKEFALNMLHLNEIRRLEIERDRDVAVGRIDALERGFVHIERMQSKQNELIERMMTRLETLALASASPAAITDDSASQAAASH